MTDSCEPSSAERVFTALLKSNDPLSLFSASDCDIYGGAIEDTSIPLTFSPLEALPCANRCSKPARLPCGRCKLVAYCSQKCEREHRNVHKRDCGVFPGSSAFRVPGPQDENQCSSRPLLHEETTLMVTPLFALGLRRDILQLISLSNRSRNLPAVDIINLKHNEEDGERDFSLAFIVSGDLRNVVRTVNALRSDYQGRLHFLLNDNSKTIVSRNIVLLLILGAMPNEAVAADIALHFWYSVFLPEEYRLRILALLVLILQHHTDRTEPLFFDLGRRAKLACLVPQEITDHLLYTAGPTLSTSLARDECERVHATPARLDARNRALAGLKACHRLGFIAFWRSGVVLPFSTISDHYTAPNTSLFSSCGTWLPDIVENPIGSWDPNEIIKSGQAHGAQSEDIYGCLYFFLSDQLRTFAKRIRELDITFHVFNTAADALAQDITCGKYSRYGLTPSIRFDRIDFAHALMDSGDARDVLESWTKLLAPGDTAAVVAVFSDWINTQKDGSVSGADEAVVAPIVGKLIKLGRLPLGMTLQDAMTTETAQLDAAYDNSKAFSRFIKTRTFADVLRKTSLKRRLRHKILSQRVRVPTDAKASDLPHLPDDETWYRYVKLARVSFTARYVELVRTGA